MKRQLQERHGLQTLSPALPSGRLNFRERRTGEVRRTPLPRTRVNRGIRKGRTSRWLANGYICDRNIVASTYNHGGMPVEATAKNVDKTARTAYEMAEAQRGSFGLAEGGLEFMRLQEDNARAAQEFFANGVRLLQLQQKNAQFVQGWMGEALEVVREQTEQN